MSNKVSVLVYSRKVGSPIRKAVLAYFAERASDNGSGVWASKTTIAAEIECGRSTVIRTINDFVKEGLLVPVGTRPCRNGETVEYAIDLDAIRALPGVDEAVTRPAAGPVPERDPSQSGTPPVPQRDPYPSRSGTQTIIGTTIEPSYTPLPPKGGYSSEFEAFWEIYPRKVGKGQAARAFDRKAKKFGAGVVMDGLRRQLPMLNAQNKGPGQDYRPHPATWLNGDRFNDPVEHKPSLLERMANGTDDLAGPRAVDRWATGVLPAPIRNAKSPCG